MGWVGIAGIAAGAVLMIYVPSLKPIANTLFLFAGFHLVGLSVLLASIYVMGGRNLGKRLASAHKPTGTQFDFGWAPAWIYGPWIAALIQIASAVVVLVAAPAYWPAAMAGTLFAAASFAGGLVSQLEYVAESTGNRQNA
jgi:hypothetical protein